MAEDRICVGAIAGAFGVRGEVRLKSFCAQPGDIAGYGPLTSEDGKRSFAVTLTRPVNGGLGARLSGIAAREAALAGLGIALLPFHLCFENLAEGTLVRVLSGQVGRMETLYALVTPERRRSPLIRALLDSIDSFSDALPESARTDGQISA
ncbi:MAG: LysR substrate-binding domain-containing protein [Paracoccus sp. (in: a-proteobacteria)]